MNRKKYLISRFARHYKKATPEIRKLLSMAHETGYDEAYWDWRDTVLSWFMKKSFDKDVKDELLAYLEELRNKSKPE